MRLLICTQAVDLDDPVLAFFHAWIAGFAKHCEAVHVICLKEGRHALPENVTVHSLGKEGGRSLFKYVFRFYRYIWQLRRGYDAVFVHMNPEYAVLGGPLWRITGKKVALWYIHPRSTFMLRVAAAFANHIFSASKDSFPFATPKLTPLGHGIDIGFFSPGNFVPSSVLRVMHVGRLAPVKNIEVILDAVEELSAHGISVSFDQYGEELPPDATYAAHIRERATSMQNCTFHGKATPTQISDAYRTHDVHVNATTSGSFDKAVLESMATGTITVASSKALTSILPDDFLFEERNANSLAKVLENIAHMSEVKRRELRSNVRKSSTKSNLQQLLATIVQKLEPKI
ncbi:MAG: glycosyltransferase family 4 protein [Patescibacteria group bacterium]